VLSIDTRSAAKSYYQTQHQSYRGSAESKGFSVPNANAGRVTSATLEILLILSLALMSHKQPCYQFNRSPPGSTTAHRAIDGNASGGNATIQPATSFSTSRAHCIFLSTAYYQVTNEKRKRTHWTSSDETLQTAVCVVISLPQNLHAPDTFFDQVTVISARKCFRSWQLLLI
jgi:hypothetical protein